MRMQDLIAKRAKRAPERSNSALPPRTQDLGNAISAVRNQWWSRGAYFNAYGADQGVRPTNPAAATLNISNALNARQIFRCAPPSKLRSIWQRPSHDGCRVMSPIPSRVTAAGRPLAVATQPGS